MEKMQIMPICFKLLFCFRVPIKDREVKVNIFDMAGHPIFYEVSAYS